VIGNPVSRRSVPAQLWDIRRAGTMSSYAWINIPVVFESIKDTFATIEENGRYEIGDSKKWRTKYGGKNDSVI
jgi:hypothetical protein